MFWCCLGVWFFRFVVFNFLFFVFFFVFLFFFPKEKNANEKQIKKLLKNKIEGIILNLETEMDADVTFFECQIIFSNIILIANI